MPGEWGINILVPIYKNKGDDQSCKLPWSLCYTTVLPIFLYKISFLIILQGSLLNMQFNDKKNGI